MACAHEGEKATSVSRKGRDSLPLQLFTTTDRKRTEARCIRNTKARFEIGLQHRRLSFLATFAEKRERPATLWDDGTERRATSAPKGPHASPTSRSYPYTNQPFRERTTK